METLRELATNIPGGFVKALILNGSVISIIYYLFWKKFKDRFIAWRIQVKQRVDTKQLKREIKNGLTTLLVRAIFASVVFYLSSHGYTRIYTSYSDHHPAFAWLGFFILLIIDDTWFYWCHRLLHLPKVFNYVHAEHHKSVDVNPYTSMSFHFLEPALLSFWIFPVAFLFPVYAPVLGVVQLWGLLDNIKSHVGYEFYPASLNKSFLRFLTSSTHHNMHHQKFHGNYGVHFRIWDRLMKTEFTDYEQEYDNVQSRKSNRVKPEHGH